MIYNIRHRTTYSSTAPITFARCVLRLTPRSSASQTVFKSAVTITPTPSQVVRRIGPFGEEVMTARIEKPHNALVIEATSRIERHSPPQDSLYESPSWETVREQTLATNDISAQSPAAFLYPTAQTPLTPQITDYVRSSFPAGRPIARGAAELMQRLHDEFVYDPEATTVSTPIAHAFAGRHGVCQDFSQIMIAGLRGLGLPAAYVSGYLRTIPPPGKVRLAGADATHAWVNLWCGAEEGWIGFDPTNAILARDDHITLAIGRDYADIAPVDCIILSAGEQKLKVAVDVIPEGEAVVTVGAALAGR